MVPKLNDRVYPKRFYDKLGPRSQRIKIASRTKKPRLKVTSRENINNNNNNKQTPFPPSNPDY